MIKNKKRFYLAFIPFIAALLLNFPFPHKQSFGEVMASKWGIPIVSTYGFHYVGITSLFLLIISLFLLSKSLKKYQGRFIFLAILIAFLLPSFLVETYQKTFAQGIYAIAYDEESSECKFETIKKDTLQAICEFSFQNHSNENVSFSIDFYENYPFEEDVKMLSLMNQSAPYKVTIAEKRQKRVEIKTEIDVSTIKSHVESGSAYYVGIILKQGDLVREL